MRASKAVYAAVALAAVAGCSGGGLTRALQTCGPPPLIPAPIGDWLNYPPDGSTNVPPAIGEIIIQSIGAGNGFPIVVQSAAGSVPLGAPTTAPSPYPTPFATAPPEYSSAHIAIPLPTLSPSTTYTVMNVYTGWNDNPPQCSAQYSVPVGSFRTGQ